ncbi:MFS transporter [Salinibacterium sp. SWN248]|uniref:MFS transporter n=1 Tax=Salinibacterium sp. SWN248 TaxID=2792056 RepID=UPI0018CF5C88|nr:MFS transporter [Salinibacterium sp. SWN248]MBH0024821.1 MFS transporter [Salinibacterium sp. SWN248]
MTTAVRKRRSPWWVVFGGGVAGAFGPGPVVLSTLGIFVIPITDETGWGRTVVTGAYSVAAIGMAIGLPIVGRMVDKYALRPVLVICWTGFTAFTAVIALTPADNVVLFLVPFFLLGFFGAGTSLTFTKALMSWFDNKRALAVGVMAAITGLGTSFVPIIAGVFIGNYGWRTAYPLMALIALVVALTMTFAFVRVRAERSVKGRLVTESVEDGEVVSLELPGLTLGEALRGRHFWMLALALGFVGVTIVGLQVHLVPMMSDRGLGVPQAVLLVTIFGLASLVGRLVGGVLIDRIDGRIIGPIVIIAPAIGLFFLHTPFLSAAIAVGLIGLAYGIEADLIAFFVSRYLGMKHFGRILGVVLSAFLLGTAFGPLLLGLAYDTFGAYDPVIPVLAGVLVVSAITIAFLGKYPYPAIEGFDKVAATDEMAAAEALSKLARQEDSQAEASETVLTK